MSEHDEYCICRACTDRDAQRERDEELFGETVVVSSWPEMGQQTISVESMFQAFKRRLERERTP